MKHLESFVTSHKNSDLIIDLMLSSSIPILSQLEKGVYASTLYGSLCLISQIKDISSLGSTYENVVLVWLGNSFYWIMNKSFELKSSAQNETSLDSASDYECIQILSHKFLNILNNNTELLNDCTCQIATMLKLCNLNKKC